MAVFFKCESLSKYRDVLFTSLLLFTLLICLVVSIIEIDICLTKVYHEQFAVDLN